MKRKQTSIFLLFSLLTVFVGSISVAYGQDVTITLPGGETMELVWIDPGTFIMGSSDGEPHSVPTEKPQHEVTITEGFWLGKYEITQRQWESVMGTKPWLGQEQVIDNPNYPASYLSWIDVQDFFRALNDAGIGYVFRFPTEAEWEYACRAGTTSCFYWGEYEGLAGNYAWYRDNTCDVGDCYPHEVGLKQPNPWGLYDIVGNVIEWVYDRWDETANYPDYPVTDPTGQEEGNIRVHRGGFYDSWWGELRCAKRAAHGQESPGRPIQGARILMQLWTPPLPEYRFFWVGVQHVAYEGGPEFNRLGFMISDRSGQLISEDVVESVSLIDPNGYPVNMADREFQNHKVAQPVPSYDSNSGRWVYPDGDIFRDNNVYFYRINDSLISGTYTLTITDNYGRMMNRQFTFSNRIDLPIIPSHKIRYEFDSEGIFICEWPVPYNLEPSWTTHSRCHITIYQGDMRVAQLFSKLPTHLGRLFVPKYILDKIIEQGTEYELRAELRTNDDSNRSYSSPIKLKLDKQGGKIKVNKE